MRDITYTAFFDEVLAEAGPNLPDHIKPRPYNGREPSTNSPRATEGRFRSGGFF